MAVPSVILDGTMPYGTGSAITINSVSYIMNNEVITPDWAEAKDNAGTGSPGRRRWTKQYYTWEAELQLATSGTAFPPPGSTFQRTPPNEASPVTFYVVQTPYNSSNQPSDIRVAKITAHEAKNSVTTA